MGAHWLRERGVDHPGAADVAGYLASLPRRGLKVKTCLGARNLYAIGYGQVLGPVTKKTDGSAFRLLPLAANRRLGAQHVSERSIMQQTGHRSTAMVRRYVRDGSLFRENAAAKLGL